MTSSPHSRPLALAVTLALLAMPMASAGTARAADAMAFTPAAFEAAKSSGKPILIDVTAPWCPTCRAQQPILTKLLADVAYRDLAVFRIDYDGQKAALRKLGVSAQGTLIAYRGGREAGRSTGDTDASSIKALVDRAL